MTMTEKYINDNIYLPEMSYYNDEPCPIGGKILVEIDATGLLEKEADKIRMFFGYVPLFDFSGEYDEDGWYDFFVEATKDNVEHLYFEPSNTWEDNGGMEWEIPLVGSEKRLLHRRLRDLFGEEKWESIWRNEV